MKKKKIQLRECPFCEHASAPRFTQHGKIAGQWAVICDFTEGGCGAMSGYTATEKAAAEIWNKRGLLTTAKKAYKLIDDINGALESALADENIAASPSDPLTVSAIAEATLKAYKRGRDDATLECNEYWHRHTQEAENFVPVAVVNSADFDLSGRRSPIYDIQIHRMNANRYLRAGETLYAKVKS